MLVNQASDTVNGVTVIEGEAQDSSNFILEAQVIEAQSNGNSLTNKGFGSTRISSRIEKAFINGFMINFYLDTMVKYLPSGISAHTPLVVTVVSGCQGNRRREAFQIQ